MENWSSISSTCAALMQINSLYTDKLIESDDAALLQSVVLHGEYKGGARHEAACAVVHALTVKTQMVDESNILPLEHFQTQILKPLLHKLRASLPAELKKRERIVETENSTCDDIREDNTVIPLVNSIQNRERKVLESSTSSTAFLGVTNGESVRVLCDEHGNPTRMMVRRFEPNSICVLCSQEKCGTLAALRKHLKEAHSEVTVKLHHALQLRTGNLHPVAEGLIYTLLPPSSPNHNGTDHSANRSWLHRVFTHRDTIKWMKADSGERLSEMNRLSKEIPIEMKPFVQIFLPGNNIPPKVGSIQSIREINQRYVRGPYASVFMTWLRVRFGSILSECNVNVQDPADFVSPSGWSF